MPILAIGAIASLGTQIYSGQKSKKEASKQLGGIANQRDQVDVINAYKQLVQDFPGLYDAIAPRLTGSAGQIGQGLTDSNVRSFLSARDAIDPAAAGIQARRAGLINELDPANLGQEELLAITRQLSPLIPTGTLDPRTGAVQGATTSPVSLYRNLISGNYNQRRQEFLQQASQFNIEATSSAERQRERAAPFLEQALNFGFNNSANVAGAGAQAQLNNISGQQRITELLLSGSQSQTSNADSIAKIAGILAGGTKSTSGTVVRKGVPI